MITIQQLVADAHATRGGAAALARDLGVSASTLTRVLAGSVPTADLMARASRLRPDLDVHATIAASDVGAVLSGLGVGVRAVWSDGEVVIRPHRGRTVVDGVVTQIVWGRAYGALGTARTLAEWREDVDRG